MRIADAPVSATTMLPVALSTATPLGPLNRAPLPVPSEALPVPPPASVVTVMSGAISRIRLLPVSPTTTSPVSVFTATPHGEEKRAFVPTASR